MEIDGLISAVVVGLIVGALGRLVVPGRQSIAIWLTMVVGIVAALIGSAIASVLGFEFFLTLVVQVLLAAAGVTLVAGSGGRRSTGR